jgi:hypothetical protein
MVKEMGNGIDKRWGADGSETGSVDRGCPCSEGRTSTPPLVRDNELCLELRLDDSAEQGVPSRQGTQLRPGIGVAGGRPLYMYGRR